MKSLLELETAAIDLSRALHSDTSIGLKQRLFFSLFHHLAALPEPERFRSYYLQFAPMLPTLCEELNSACLDPAVLEQWLKDLSQFHQFAELHHQAIETAGEAVRAAAILHALYAGDETTTARLAGLELPDELRPHRSRLELALSVLSRLPSSLQNKLADSLRGWQKEHGTYMAGKLYMMLVDVDSAAASEDNSGGLLIPLYATGRERPVDAEEDLCRLNNQIDFGKNALYWTLLDGLQAARTLLPEAAAKWHYAIHYSIPEKSAAMNGTSLGLAAALLAWTAALNCYHQHPAARLGGNLAVTGGVDSQGNIMGVDAAGLRAKITAAFFSPIDRLYIPAANWREALTILAPLERRYPGRHLLIHPLENLEQALQDRNLVERTRPGPARRLVALVRRKRSRPVLLMLTAAVMLALLIANVPAFIAWRDRTPVQFEFQGKQMICRNANGYRLWEYTFDFQPNDSAYSQAKGTILVDDLDGDGRKETILGTHETMEPEHSATLYAFSAKGTLLWPPLRLGRPLQNQEGEWIDDYYHTSKLRSVSFGPGQPKAILVTISHFNDYPSSLALVSFTGKQLGAFWNAGHIIHEAVADLDQDEEPEILAGGYDNETGRAWVGVFHPQELQGASPRSTPHYTLSGIPIARPALLLRFPSSPFWVKGGYRDRTVAIEPNRHTIRIHLSNPGFYYGFPGASHATMYGYHLANDLESITLNELADYFKDQYLAVFGQPLSPAGLQQLLQVERWDGHEWVPFPASYGTKPSASSDSPPDSTF